MERSLEETHSRSGEGGEGERVWLYLLSTAELSRPLGDDSSVPTRPPGPCLPAQLVERTGSS